MPYVDYLPLPPDWEKCISRSTGQTYYFNCKTGESVQERLSIRDSVVPSVSDDAVAALPSPSSSSSSSAKRSRVDENNVNSFSADASGPSSSVQLPIPATDLASSKVKALTVASKYDDLGEAGLEARGASGILHLRAFNNWIKSALIQEFAPRPCHRVLDLACGKLGDLKKWKLAGVQEYCGIDIAVESLKHGAVRLASSSSEGGGGGGARGGGGGGGG